MESLWVGESSGVFLLWRLWKICRKNEITRWWKFSMNFEFLMYSSAESTTDTSWSSRNICCLCVGNQHSALLVFYRWSRTCLVLVYHILSCGDCRNAWLRKKHLRPSKSSWEMFVKEDMWISKISALKLWVPFSVNFSKFFVCLIWSLDLRGEFRILSTSTPFSHSSSSCMPR